MCDDQFSLDVNVCIPEERRGDHGLPVGLCTMGCFIAVCVSRQKRLVDMDLISAIIGYFLSDIPLSTRLT